MKKEEGEKQEEEMEREEERKKEKKRISTNHLWWPSGATGPLNLEALGVTKPNKGINQEE